MKDKDIYLIIGILVIIIIFGKGLPFMALITPGVVEDGYTLLSETNLPMTIDSPTKTTLDKNVEISYDGTNYFTETLPFSTGISYQKVCTDTASLTTWCNPEGTSKTCDQKYKAWCKVPDDCIDLSPKCSIASTTCLNSCSTWGRWVTSSCKDTCYASICQTLKIEGWCNKATGTGWLIDENTIHIKKTFTVPVDSKGVWLWIDPPQVSQGIWTDTIDRPNHQYTLQPGNTIGECYLNGQTLSLNSKAKPPSSGSSWMYEYYVYHDVSQYAVEGENILTCTLNKKTGQIGDINWDIVVYDSSNCQTFSNSVCDYAPEGIPLFTNTYCENWGVKKLVKCDFDEWDINYYNKWDNKFEGTIFYGTTTLTGYENDIILTGTGHCWAEIGSNSISTKDLGGNSFRVDIDYSRPYLRSGCGDHYEYNKGYFSINVAEQEVYNSGDVEQMSGLFEANPQFLSPDNIDIYFQGQKLITINTAGQELKVSFGLANDNPGSGILKLTNARYQLPFNCHMEANDLLAMESFTGGQEISLYSTRYTVKSFCLEHPVIVTSPEGSTTTAEPYQLFILGETTTIPADQTWTMFYVMKNPGTIPVTCPEEFYDVATGMCTTVGGIIQICSQGTFDPELGVCIVQPESVCAEGYFDTALGLCVYHPPVQYICELGIYSELSGKCEYTPSVEGICTIGTWNPESGFCEVFPLEQIICPTGTAYSAKEGACIGEGIVVNPITAEEQCELLDGNYNPETGVCTFEETYKNWCIQQGFDYDASKNSCTYVEEIVPEEIEEIVPKKEPEYMKWIFYILIGLIIYYVLFEAGPKKGIFKSKKYRKK